MTLSSKKIAAMKPRDKRYSVADGNGVTAPRPICNKSGEASCFFNTARTIVRVLHVSTGYGS